MSVVMGVDLSLTSTGLAVISDGVASVDRVTSSPNGHAITDRWRRLRALHHALYDWTLTPSPALVVIEGPSYGSTSPHTHDRSGLWWLVVHRLLSSDVPLAVVPPTSRAKYATGKGNAAKDAVLAAVVRRYADVDVTGNDSADALVLAAMGARWLGRPIDDPMPKSHAVALDGVAWPERWTRDEQATQPQPR